MNEKQAKFISILAHPVFTPLLGIVILFHSISYFSTLQLAIKTIIILIALAFFTFIPIIMMPILKYFRVIQSLQMETQQERMVPFFVTSLCYFTGYYLASTIEVIPYTFVSFFLAVTISSILIGIINFKWKISAHAIGWGGLLGLVISMNLFFQINTIFILNMLLVVSGIVATSRLLLGAHSPLQIYSGFCLGFLVVFLVMLFL